VRQAGAERSDPTRERRDQYDADHGDEAERQPWQQGLMRRAGEDIPCRAGERDRDAAAADAKQPGEDAGHDTGEHHACRQPCELTHHRVVIVFTGSCDVR
jgi:hypothetical protein